MKKNRHITAFYLETLLLILVFITIILVLTQVFGLGKVQSSEAKLLTNAVCLAENAAEAVSASDSDGRLLQLLDENGNAERMPDTAGVTAYYDTDMRPDRQGAFRVDVSWLPREGETGVLVDSVIQVRCGERAKPIYTLNTAVFLKEVGQ